MSDEPSSQHHEALPADLAAVQHTLLHDGKGWRQQIPVSARLEQYVMTRVPRQAASPISPQGNLSMATRTTETRPGTNAPRRARTTYPIVAVVLLLVLVGGFFGLRALHPSSNRGPGTVGTSSTIGRTPTVAPSSGQWFSLTQVVYHQDAPTPLNSFIIGYDEVMPQHLISQAYADPQKIHQGDHLTLVWKLNGVVLTGPQCCHFQLSPMQNSTGFMVPVTTTGTGSVTISYNTTLAFTATFTVVASSTPPVVPATPTATPS